MAAFAVRRSFFIRTFAILFAVALFFASLLPGTEFPRNRPQIAPASVVIPAKDHAVFSTELFTQDNAPRISVIVDDAGQDLELLEALLQVQFPVTISILPGTRYAKESAEWARDHGIEVMVHLPMEPEDFPEKDPGSNALLTSMTRKELVERTSNLLDEIPFAAGANNHMGSLLTSRAEKMNVVLNVIARRGLFFVDSRTSAATIGFKLAQQKAIPAAERTLFLDNPGDVLTIRARFEQLVGRGKQDGHAIGICHLKTDTVAELSKVEIAHYSGVEFTFASGIVAKRQPRSHQNTKYTKLN